MYCVIQEVRRKKPDPYGEHKEIIPYTPLAGDGEDALTLADTLPDPSAEAAILEVAEQDFAARRCAAVEEAINSLPEAEQTAIRRKYYQNETPDAFAHAKALRMLRHPSRSRALMAYW